MDRIFETCCDWLAQGGRLIGCSYEETSVIVNLFVQGGILWLAGMMSMVEGLRLQPRARSRFSRRCAFVGILDGFASSFLYILLLWHYRGGMQVVFARCGNDLIRLAEAVGCTYQEINVAIFIVGFLVILALQIAIFMVVRHARRTAMGGTGSIP